MRASEFLIELRKISSGDDIEGKYFILTDTGYVILFDEGEDIDLPDDLLDDDITDMIDDIQSYIDLSDKAQMKYIVGAIDNNYAELYYVDFESKPTQILNSNLKKLVKELNLDGMRYSYTDIDYNQEEYLFNAEKVIKSNLQNITVFHGTNYKFLTKILKIGLRPVEHTNFKNINHENKIFFTTKQELAKFHASNSASLHISIPFVIAMKIPDPSKVVLDYDIAIQQYGVDHPLTVKLGYQVIYHGAGGRYGKEIDYSADDVPRMLSDKNSLNTKIGIFGYEGQIPPTYIKQIYGDPYAIAYYENYDELPEQFNNDWYTKKEFKKAYEDAIQDIEDGFDEDF